jgi:hypothetical protein
MGEQTQKNIYFQRIQVRIFKAHLRCQRSCHTNLSSISDEKQGLEHTTTEKKNKVKERQTRKGDYSI